MMNNSFVKFAAYLVAFGVFGSVASVELGSTGWVIDVQSVCLLVVLLDVGRALLPSWRAFQAYMAARVSEGGKSIVLDSKADRGKLAVFNIVKSAYASVFGWLGSFGAGNTVTPPTEYGEKVEIKLDRTAQNEAKS